MSNPLYRNPKDVLPEVSWEKIAPPYLDYDYFNGVKIHPFRYRANMFDMVNAWWLIEASILAYAEEDFASPIFHLQGHTMLCGKQ
jgi:triacylglycerol lipase